MNTILVLNAGSYSLKYKLFRQDQELLAGHIEGIDGPGVHSVRRGTLHSTQSVHARDHLDAILHALKQIAKDCPLQDIDHVLHRVVHGGERFPEHCVVTPAVEQGIKQLAMLAPLHNPANLAGIKAAKRALPNAEHIAFFDTAFHHTIPKHVFLYGLPYRLYEKWGIRKYGFHGLSHQYITETVYDKLQATSGIVSCHLGSGSSITAIQHGKSVDTTMGFTPLDGLLMATRSGELDPDIPLFLLEHEHYTPKQLAELLNENSGIKGLVGTGDMREVKQKADQGDRMAKLVIEMLCYRIAGFVGSYHISVAGMKVLTFTGGIGENAPYIRSGVCRLLEPLGVELDESANKRNEETISTPYSKVKVMVFPANEELEMVRLFLAGKFVQ